MAGLCAAPCFEIRLANNHARQVGHTRTSPGHCASADISLCMQMLWQHTLSADYTHSSESLAERRCCSLLGRGGIGQVGLGIASVVLNPCRVNKSTLMLPCCSPARADLIAALGETTGEAWRSVQAH